MLDYMKLKKMAHDQEAACFGPDPEGLLRMRRQSPPSGPIPLETWLRDRSRQGRLLEWMEQHATFADAKRCYLAFHAAWQRVLNGDEQYPIVLELRERARDGASAEDLILATIDAGEV